MSTFPQNPQANETFNANTPAKSAGVAYALWFFLGSFGAHRFYFGRTGSAIGMLALFVGSILTTPILVGFAGFLAFFGWWVFDAVQISKWCSADTAQGATGAGFQSFPAPAHNATEPAGENSPPMSQAA